MYSNSYVKMFSGNENKAYCKTCKATRKNWQCNSDTRPTAASRTTSQRLSSPKPSQFHSCLILLIFVTQNGSQHSHKPSSNLAVSPCCDKDRERGAQLERAPGPDQPQKQNKAGDCFLFLGQIASLQALVCAKHPAEPAQGWLSGI